MSRRRSCYSCVHVSLCRFHAAVQDAIESNLGLVDVDLPSDSPQHWQQIIHATGRACVAYTAAAEEDAP